MSVRISIDVSGYYDWEPCPPGTEITEDDVKALRVKQMADDKWAMKVTKKADTHHDVGIPESQIESRMAGLIASGDEPTREEVVAELLRANLRHHVHSSHLGYINVTDDEGDGDGLEKYLNQVFRTKGKKL